MFIDTSGSPTPTPPDNARELLDQIAAIPTMERGKLTAEFRPRADADAGGDGPAMLGPYYKLQSAPRPQWQVILSRGATP